MYVNIHYIISLTTHPLNDEGKIDIMCIIDVCIYSLYHPSHHTPLNDNVCGTCMDFIVIYIIVYIYNHFIISLTTPPKWRCMPHIYIHKRQSHRPNLWYVHNQVIHIEITVLTLWDHKNQAILMTSHDATPRMGLMKNKFIYISRLYT